MDSPDGPPATVWQFVKIGTSPLMSRVEGRLPERERPRNLNG